MLLLTEALAINLFLQKDPPAINATKLLHGMITFHLFPGFY